MSDHEQIERVRQQIMRLRELLTIMSKSVDNGEKAYARLFALLSEEEKSGLKEKDLQWKAAERMIGDLTPLKSAAMDLRFGARELERNFEQLYDIIASSEEINTQL
jgi:hypothetical protein